MLAKGHPSREELLPSLEVEVAALGLGFSTLDSLHSHSKCRNILCCRARIGGSEETAPAAFQTIEERCGGASGAPLYTI